MGGLVFEGYDFPTSDLNLFGRKSLFRAKLNPGCFRLLMQVNIDGIVILYEGDITLKCVNNTLI